MADENNVAPIKNQREQNHTTPTASPSTSKDSFRIISRSEKNSILFSNALKEQAAKSQLMIHDCVFFVLAEGELPEYSVLQEHIHKGTHVFLIVLLQENTLSPHKREEKAELLHAEVVARTKIRLEYIYVLTIIPEEQKLQEMQKLLRVLSTVLSDKSEDRRPNPSSDRSIDYDLTRRDSTVKKAARNFDAFLCYNWEDRAVVRQLAEQLKQQGLSPWLDEWEAQPGLPWQRAIEAQIEQITAAAVFVGRAGIGPWQQEEIDALLREFVKRKCPVIPVLLENTPREPLLPVFLRGMKWVDFRKQDPDPMNQLLWGITGQRIIS
jgi:nucleotide-binding universal stress UspA family protein